jgi:hypothetical protein
LIYNSTVESYCQSMQVNKLATPFLAVSLSLSENDGLSVDEIRACGAVVVQEWKDRPL